MTSKWSSKFFFTLALILLFFALIRFLVYLHGDPRQHLMGTLQADSFLPEERKVGEILLECGFEIHLSENHIVEIRAGEIPTWITNEQLAEVARLPRLQSFELHQNYSGIDQSRNLTDQGFSHLQHATSLKRLNLNYSGITDDGLETLGALPHLQELILTGTTVSGTGAEKIIDDLPELNLLVLKDTLVSKDLLKKLRGRPGLSVLGFE